MKKKMLLLAGVLLTVLLAAGWMGYQRLSGKKLPVLMYHHFEDTSSYYTIVSETRFREQMEALKAAGYETVTLQQVYNYVHHDGTLPEKPVMITMDDGYTSNLEVAAPILEELGMCATVFVIGICEGETAYPHTGEVFGDPRFAYEAAVPWVEKGVLDIQCHTFDMHQLAEYAISGRDGMLRKDGEAPEDYEKALDLDYQQFVERREGVIETELMALAYPFGFYDRELDALLEDRFSVTVTTDEHINRLRQGEPDTLRMLGRFNVEEFMTGEFLVDKLDKQLN